MSNVTSGSTKIAVDLRGTRVGSFGTRVGSLRNRFVSGHKLHRLRDSYASHSAVKYIGRKRERHRRVS